MSQEIYTKLREFLHNLPGGFPETDTGIEIKLLQKLFTPEEAELTMKMTETPETVSQVAERLGEKEDEMARKLESLAQNGLIFRIREDGTPLYQAYQFLVGIYEFQLKRMDREFAELFEAYLPYWGIGMSHVKTDQMRTIPVGAAARITPEIARYNDVRQLIKDKAFISVQECICRKEQELLGNPCDYTREICIGFDDFARFYVDNGMGRQIDMAETLKLLDIAEKEGLVLKPNNAQDVDAICCCCSCCCPSLRFAKMMNRPIDAIETSYVARINADLCTACEECQERCPMDAIKLDDDVSETIDERCIGCGVCIPTCAEEAITLELRAGVSEPPADFDETFQRIRTERGLV